MKYSLKEMPQQMGVIRPGADKYYVRFKVDGTLNADELAERAALGSTFSAIEIKAALMQVARAMAEALADGYRVEVGEIGSFSPKAKTLTTSSPDKINGRNVELEGLTFRPKRELIKEISDRIETVERVSDGFVPEKSRLTKEQRLRKVSEIAHDNNGEITISLYAAATGVSRSTAQKELAEAYKKGKIVAYGRAPHLTYRLK